MKSSQDLRANLRSIDHRSYPAYKDLRGQYDFGSFVLSIDHVQGDPFASPSRLSVLVSGKKAGFPAEYYDTYPKRITLQDHLTRLFAAQLSSGSKQAKGSGKSGLLGASRCGQEVLERTACRVREGNVTLRFEAGFPARGRTIDARELEKMLFDILPDCVHASLYFQKINKNRLKAAIELCEDQQYIREQLPALGLCAFLANGSILPRQSGVSDRPMQEAVAFQSPASMEVTLDLPNRGPVTGMGIPKGITLFVGGGYHGKSTVLQALQYGVYNHIGGDGRELVITDESAWKLRSEDGRSVTGVDISPFIRQLPGRRDTRHFSTEDASGSTSQAAATVEAVEMGAGAFLIDEDTSATNFMIRDELMQRVVSRDMEPIIPFIDRVRELYENYGISTVLVAGSCGSYFHKADCILQMNKYRPMEITALAKKEAEQFPYTLGSAPAAGKPDFHRVVKADQAFARDERIKMKTMGLDGFSINRETVDMRYVEQLADSEQLTALSHMIRHMKCRCFDGRKTLQQAVEALYEEVEKNSFAAFCPGRESLPGNLAMPRRQELYAALNRCRELVRI